MIQRKRSLMAASVVMALIVTSTALANPGHGSNRPESVQLKDARLKIERNDTDGDAGIRSSSTSMRGGPWTSTIRRAGE